MRKPTKVIFIIGLALLIYGYLSREVELYFFWDSKAFGWIVFFIGLFLYLIDVKKLRGRQGKKTIWATVGIFFMALGFILSAYLIFDFHKSEPYQTAIDYLKKNVQIKKEVGKIKGFGLIPAGSIETTSINGWKSGRATLFLTIFGEKKFKDLDVNLRKTAETDWQVISVY